MALKVQALSLVLLAAGAAAGGSAGAASRHGAVAGAAARVTPLQKLIQMLEGMQAKGKKEKHAEEVEFAKFHEWCDGVRAAKTKSIKEAEEEIMQLEADIEKAEADAKLLAGEVADLEAAINKAEAEMASATAVRKKENADYTAEHKDLSESIDACRRAKDTIMARSPDVAQSLAQLQESRSVPVHAKAVLTSFLAAHDGEFEAGVPEANAYEFQSGGVVEMLEKLALQFKDQLLAVQKEEMSAKANYEMLMQQLEDDVKADKAAAAAKTKTKAARLESAAVAKGDLKSATATKAEDEKTLSDTTAECQARSEEFEANQVTRADEVKAIEKAVEILSSGAVSGNADTYLPAAALLQAGSSLAQLQHSKQGEVAVRQQAVEFLQGQARKLDSHLLNLAAARAAADPFAKVKKMIKGLIVKLMEQANAEADQHAYCTTELATNKQTRENKASEIEDLSATVDQLSAESSKLASEIQELSDAIAELKGQQSEATKIRGEEKATNAKTVADAKEAQAAVAVAAKVLREYYAKAAGAAFVQNVQGEHSEEMLRNEMSQAIRAPYRGMQAESGGIFGMLEVVLSDFARLETQTQAAEQEAVAAYEKFMAESEESVAVKEKAVAHKTAKKDLTEETARRTKRELELTQAELEEAATYYDKLKAECLDTGLSYADRVRAREEEMQSLKEALRILEQSDLA